MEARSPREKDLLKYGVKQGIEQERERIIKLLESYYKPEDTKTICTINHEQYLDFIELIKGEQK